MNLKTSVRSDGWVLNAVVITITLLVLAAIIIPTIGKVSDCGPRPRDSSNLRQIGQACMIYASDHNNQLPQTDTLTDFAAALVSAFRTLFGRAGARRSLAR